MRFTGGDSLTGFRKLVHQIMMQNELRNGEGAYEVSHAKAGRSGYSFGPVQWDLLSNHLIKNDPDPNNRIYARQAFDDILANAKYTDGSLVFDDNSRTSVINKVVTKGAVLTEDQKSLINDALESDYGIREINDLYPIELDNAITKIDSIISNVADPGSRAFLQTDIARLFLIDYNNQFNINTGSKGEMKRFLDGESVLLGSGYKVQVQGNLGVEDLLTFYLKTK